jgi:hypothetical protein
MRALPQVQAKTRRRSALYDAENRMMSATRSGATSPTPTIP